MAARDARAAGRFKRAGKQTRFPARFFVGDACFERLLGECIACSPTPVFPASMPHLP